MIVQGPGIPAGKIVADPVSTLDLAPTFHDLAGLAVPPRLQGTSLAPLTHGASGAARDAAYRDDKLSLQRGSLGIRDASATGVTGHGAKTAAIGGLSASNTDYAEGATKVHATPVRPARAVRPMRWM